MKDTLRIATIDSQEESMEETKETQEKGMEHSCNLTDEIPFGIDDFIPGFEPSDEMGESANVSNESMRDEKNIPPNVTETMDEIKKRASKLYSDPYCHNIDPGVPAPLRLYWRDVDESTKNKYPTAKECYYKGKFYFRRFLKWMDRNRRAYIELSCENKKISERELKKCYEVNGEFSGWKLAELLYEKESYLVKRIKEEEELLESFNIDLRNHKKISKANIKYHGENQNIHEMRLVYMLEDKIIYLEKKIKKTKATLDRLNIELFNIEKVISRGCIDSEGCTMVDRTYEF